MRALETQMSNHVIQACPITTLFRKHHIVAVFVDVLSHLGTSFSSISGLVAEMACVMLGSHPEQISQRSGGRPGAKSHLR
jgi:hypothetical protein